MPLPKTQKVIRAKKARLQEDAQLVSYCPLCETSCDSKGAKLLGAKHDARLMHVQCDSCLNAILTLMLVSDVGVSSVGLVTDLDFAEVDRFKEAEPVTVDDVIDTHYLLNDDQRLWNALFA